MKNEFFLILLAAIFILGCTAQTAQNGDLVSVLYNASYENGTVFDNNDGKPLNFTIGNGEVIKGFNYAVIGMKVNNEKKVTIEPSDGYGLYDSSKIKATTVKSLEDAGVTPANGTVVYATMNKNLERGVIINTNGTYAWVDFNQPLAGKTLVFDIQLLNINSRAGNALK